jgi:hypothetical protein
LLPAEGFSPNSFSVELIFRPSIPDNVTNWRVFDDDQQIIHFLHMEDTFQDAIIDEITHDENLLDFSVIPDSRSIESSSELVNSIPKSVIRLEFFYDLHDKFKGVVNCKMNSSSMQYEVINLGTHDKPQNINLGTGCTQQENHLLLNCSKNLKMCFLGLMRI